MFLPVGLEAQLFGEGGLFKKKSDAPRNLTEEEIGVPVPVTGRVEALKGHEVQFELRAESKTPGATVEFLIRAFPSAGRIVSMMSNPGARNKAIVVYYADPESSATSDAFSFAVRYRGGRYSSEMRYDIDLVDLKIEVQAPPEVDFGTVPVGGEEVREVLVRNIGNGAMERQLFLAPPWHLLEPADGKLSIGPRGARNLKVAFRPELTGETSYFLSFSRSKEGTSKLIGVGAEPFRVVTEVLELTLDEKSRERRGEVELLNPGEKSVIAKARASTRLESGLRDSYVLPPGKTILVPVRLAATDTAPFDGTVQFFLENGYSQSARVIAPVVPGKIVVSVPGALSSEVVNFGMVEAGRSMERGMTLTNVGGVSVPLEFHIPEPFRLLNNPGAQLAPLSEVAISVGLFPSASQRGLVDVTMNVHGLDHTVPIRLLGNIVPSKGGTPVGTSTPATSSAPRNFRLGSGGAVGGAGKSLERVDESREASATGGDAGLGGASNDQGAVADNEGMGMGSASARNFDAELRRPEDLSVLRTGRESITLGWTAPRESDSFSFDVEVRRLMGQGGEGDAHSWGAWRNLPPLDLERIDRLVKAEIAPLAPGQHYEFRVLTKTGDGRSSLPSGALGAKTSSSGGVVYFLIIPAMALLAAGGFLFFKGMRRRSAERIVVETH